LTIKILFLINFLKYNFISFNFEIVSIGMLKYCLKLLNTIKTQPNNVIDLLQVLLKLVLIYSDILIKIYKFLEPNLSDDDENKADLNECIFILISLIEDVYNSSTLNVVDKDDDEKKISFDSIECHKLIVK
jgi:hypothetical protein